MRNYIIKKIKTADVDLLVIGQGYLSGFLGALTIMVTFHLFVDKPNKIGTVNITGIVDQFVKQESNKNVPPDKLKKEVKAFGRQLETDLTKFSKRYHVVLMPSEAIIAGSEDYTVYFHHKIASSMLREDV
jgi:hypothetical protein